MFRLKSGFISSKGVRRVTVNVVESRREVYTLRLIITYLNVTCLDARLKTGESDASSNLRCKLQLLMVRASRLYVYRIFFLVSRFSPECFSPSFSHDNPSPLNKHAAISGAFRTRSNVCCPAIHISVAILISKNYDIDLTSNCVASFHLRVANYIYRTRNSKRV